MLFTSVIKSGVNEGDRGRISVNVSAGIQFQPNGNVSIIGADNNFYLQSPTVTLGSWLPEADKLPTVGEDYEIRLTQVSGSVSGTTAGAYVSLDTVRTVEGTSTDATIATTTTDEVRVEIRKVGSGTNDVNEVISLFVNTIPGG